MNVTLTRPILQVNEYYPFGMEMAENGYENVLESENKYKYNGKELQDDLDLDWYDYGARMYDASIGRFMVTDRFSEKYYDFSPYQYGASNPVLYVDVNGDSLNVALIQRYDEANGTNYLQQITNNLTAQTGLTYTVTTGGQLVYQTDSNGNPLVATTTDAAGNTVQAGSQEARDIMTDAISNSTTAFTRITTGRSNAPVGGTLININPNQITTMMSGAQNVDPNTMGMGMTFMHEILHSAVGGGLTDPLSGSGLGPTGAVVDRMNIVRSEMNSQGYNYGQRTSYEGVTFSPTGTPAYLPFDANSLNNLRRGLVPSTTSKYLQY
jgi:RHS repeat-associated protein